MVAQFANRYSHFHYVTKKCVFLQSTMGRYNEIDERHDILPTMINLSVLVFRHINKFCHFMEGLHQEKITYMLRPLYIRAAIHLYTKLCIHISLGDYIFFYRLVEWTLHFPRTTALAADPPWCPTGTNAGPSCPVYKVPASLAAPVPAQWLTRPPALSPPTPIGQLAYRTLRSPCLALHTV